MCACVCVVERHSGSYLDQKCFFFFSFFSLGKLKRGKIVGLPELFKCLIILLVWKSQKILHIRSHLRNQKGNQLFPEPLRCFHRELGSWKKSQQGFQASLLCLSSGRMPSLADCQCACPWFHLCLSARRYSLKAGLEAPRVLEEVVKGCHLLCVREIPLSFQSITSFLF